MSRFSHGSHRRGFHSTGVPVASGVPKTMIIIISRTKSLRGGRASCVQVNIMLFLRSKLGKNWTVFGEAALSFDISSSFHHSIFFFFVILRFLLNHILSLIFISKHA